MSSQQPATSSNNNAGGGGTNTPNSTHPSSPNLNTNNSNHSHPDNHSHRQWKAALNLLWAASHLGHNAHDSALMQGGRHESLGPSQSGGLVVKTGPGGFGPGGAFGSGVAAGGATSIAEFLRTVPHFYLLSPPQLQHLADCGLRRDFLPGEVVLENGADVTQVRIILAGVVDVVDRHHGTVGTMESCSVFGLDSIIIQEKAPFRFVCSQHCSLLLLPTNDVLKVLKASPFMRQSIGRKMSGQMSCFRTLKEFSRLLFSHDAMKYEYIPLQNILESYNNMTDSVVHSLKSRKDLDTTAWYYAIMRLPENITRVFSLDLVRSLPPFLATRMRSLTRKAERARQVETVGTQQQQQAQQQQNPMSNSGTPTNVLRQDSGLGFNSSSATNIFSSSMNINTTQTHVRNRGGGSGNTPSQSPSSAFAAAMNNSNNINNHTTNNEAALMFMMMNSQNMSDYRSRDIRYVHTPQRRRCVWQLGIDGKNIVLMRDDFTDYLDFVLSLCIHIVESSKLRGRLQSLVSPSAIDVIEECLYRNQLIQQQQLRDLQQQQQQQQQQSQQASGESTKHHSRSQSDGGNKNEESINGHSSMMHRTASGVPHAVLNATGYNGVRDVTGRHGEGNINRSVPSTPNSLGNSGNNSPPSLVSPTTLTNLMVQQNITGLSVDECQEILQQKLHLSEVESQGLISIWGTNTFKHLHDVLMHREEYLLRADSSVSRRFSSDPFHDWALGVRGAVFRRLALDAHSALPEDLSIDLVFGLTRSMLNCLSPCARLYKDEILAYGNASHPEVMSQPWNCEEDKLYALIPDFLNENPEMRDVFNEHLDESGIEVLEDTALTGLQADIICADFLDQSGLDEWLQSKMKQHAPTSNQNTPSLYHSQPPLEYSVSEQFSSTTGNQQQQQQQQHANSSDYPDSTFTKSGPRFLINIDYTFGAQAEGILKTLVTLFGRRIRSVNVLGKIAGFKGTRAGDVIIADNVVSSKMSLTSEDHMDEIRTINNQGLRMERVQEFFANSKRKVRRGSILTVATSMLCDASIISYYKNIWNCTGFEIEGSYFARMVKECKSNGLLQHDLPVRHMYLVRELPEEHDGSSTFAKPRYAGEVLSAQYVIARSILDIVLRREANNSSTTPLSLSNGQQQPQAQKHAHFGGDAMRRTVTAPV